MTLIDETNCICPDGYKLIPGAKCVIKAKKVLVFHGRTTQYVNAWSPPIVLTLQDFLLSLTLKSAPKEVECFEARNALSYTEPVAIETQMSCPVTWQNKLHLLGGGIRRQVVRLDGHVLKRIGDLAVDHFLGTCTAIENKMIVLCFPYSDKYGCRWATGPLDTCLGLQGSPGCCTHPASPHLQPEFVPILEWHHLLSMF